MAGARTLRSQLALDCVWFACVRVHMRRVSTSTAHSQRLSFNLSNDSADGLRDNRDRFDWCDWRGGRQQNVRDTVRDISPQCEFKVFLSIWLGWLVLSTTTHKSNNDNQKKTVVRRSGRRNDALFYINIWHNNQLSLNPD